MELAAKNPSEASPARLPPSCSNGALRRHHPPPQAATAAAAAAGSVYRECLKNHAAAMGGHALDGCGEFMPSPLSSPSDPTSLKCAACGCHRNFHRRDDDGGGNLSAGSDDIVNGEVTPRRRSSSSTSPPPPPHAPPISSSYFPSAPHMLLALSSGLPSPAAAAPRKRFRTKFSREQKEKMFLFAEKLGWRMQKQDERAVEEFCNEIGVSKGVLKVWMHNNKHTLGKKDAAPTAFTGNTENNGSPMVKNNSHSIEESETHIKDEDTTMAVSDNGIDHKNNGSCSHLFNGSSSSS